jgi:hypothetical protein
MGDESFELTYRGPARLVGAVANQLRADDLTVSYEPPEEHLVALGDLNDVIVGLSVAGLTPYLQVAISRVRERFKGVATLDDAQQAIAERLATLDRLQADGTITDEERQRLRRASSTSCEQYRVYPVDGSCQRAVSLRQLGTATGRMSERASLPTALGGGARACDDHEFCAHDL